MKVLILGSGLLGVATAYELGKRGFEVTVLDRQAESGRETSFANGGQISYNSAEPWANLAMLSKLPGWIFRSDAPLVFRPRADLAMIKWGLKFLRNCTSARERAGCVNMLRLGLYSKECMEKLRAETGIAFDFADQGILHIFDTPKCFEHAKRLNEFQAKFGGQGRALSKHELLAVEPALANTSRNIAGGIHAFGDETGDPYLFCKALTKVASQRYGVRFKYGFDIKSLQVRNQLITTVATDKGNFSADGYVMAMGSYSPLALNPLGIHLPIYPMKGYSVTIGANDACPRASVTDGTYKIVYSRMGNKMRIAGTAEFAGYNKSINKSRIKPILVAAKRLFPGADWSQPIEEWACLRPSTPDGPPVIGKTPIANLFLNTGHGTLGWTQVAGSATILADIMAGKPPGIIIQGLTMERFL